MFDDMKDSETLVSFTTTFPPSECICVIKTALEAENFKVNVNDEIHNIWSEHYKKNDLLLEIEFNIVEICEGYYIISS